MARDGSICVFKGVDEDVCDAAHIIPRSKGDQVPFKVASYHPLTKSPLQYISQILQDHRHLYAPMLDLGINSVENGIFLGKELHAMFGKGKVAFPKVCGTVGQNSDAVNNRQFLDPQLCFGNC